MTSSRIINPTKLTGTQENKPTVHSGHSAYFTPSEIEIYKANQREGIKGDTHRFFPAVRIKGMTVSDRLLSEPTFSTTAAVKSYS